MNMVSNLFNSLSYLNCTYKWILRDRINKFLIKNDVMQYIINNNQQCIMFMHESIRKMS